MKKIIIIIPKYKYAALLLIIMLILLFSVGFLNISIFADKNVLSDKIIVIDAGHGGIDGGANNKYILEKDVNLDVALKLQKKLEESGAAVIMTRTRDEELSKSSTINRSRYIRDLTARTNIINSSGANMFVSIHTNSNPKKPSTRGMIAFYNNSHPHNREIAYIFQNVCNSYEFTYQDDVFKSHHIPQKGNYYILVNAKIPGVIVETGFITNSTDLFLLQKSEYREYTAHCIYQGIINYFLCCDKLPQKIDKTIEIEEENAIGMAEEDTEH